MKLPHRRRFLHLTAGAAALPAVSWTARADTYPTRPVHIVVGYPAGVSTDIVARLIAQSLSEGLGQQFIIDNRPGAGTNIGTELVVKAPPDGYTLLAAVSTNSINATLYKNINFNFIRDITPVAGIARGPFVMVVNPSVPANTVSELIAYTKANPGKINMASGGNGTAPHIFGELFKMMAAVDIVHVPYRSNYMADLLSGQVQLLISPIAQVIEFIKDGRLRALAVTTVARSDMLPDVPTMSEFVPGYEASGWYGMGAPKSTPSEIVDKLNKEINASLADPAIKARFADLATIPMPTTPAEFGKLIVDDTDKWGKVIRAANIKAE